MLRTFLLAFIGSVIFTRIAIALSNKLGILDHPDERKVHSKPMPLLGGVAVFGAFITALLLNFHFSWRLKGVIIASALIFISGLIDDIRGLSASVRLMIQLMASIIVISFGVRLNIIPHSVPFYLVLDIIITIIWIVGITNAMNFLDGIDGMAAGVSVVAALTFFVFAFQTGQSYFAYLNIALAGACIGFLFYNFHPARIFLGDSGSSFLGFSLASLAVMGEWADKRPVVALSVPVLVLAILIFDMIYISVARIRQGKVRTFKEWVEYVGRDHLHHRLMALGLSQSQTVFFVCLICVIFSLSALVLEKATASQALLLLGQGTLILIVMSVLMIVGQKNLDAGKGE